MNKKYIAIIGATFLAIITLTFPVFATWWFPATPDFVINETANFTSGIQTNTTTITNRYNQSANTLEMDFPYANKDANLVSYYRLEGNANDEVGINNGTITGATSTSSGKFEGAYNFSGVTQSINVSDSNTLDLTNLTISAWVKTDSLGALRTIVAKGETTSSKSLPYALMLSSGNLLYGTIGNTISYKDLTGVTALTTNTWYHVAMTVNNTDMTLYLNGVSDKTTTKTVVPFNSANQLVIGGIFKTGVLYFWNGTIDEVKIYNRSLSTTEISALYNQGDKYINTTKTSPIATWTSARQNITAGNKLKNVTINLTASASGYIDSVTWINSTGTVKATNETDITTTGLVTYSTALGLSTGTFDYLNSSETFNISIKFKGDGTATAKVDDIIGYYEVTGGDTDAPTITIQHPANTTYSTAAIWFNVSTDEDVNLCAYSWNSETNETMTNSTGNWNDYKWVWSYNCQQNVTFYCSDPAGNIGNTTMMYFFACTNQVLVAKKVLW